MFVKKKEMMSLEILIGPSYLDNLYIRKGNVRWMIVSNNHSNAQVNNEIRKEIDEYYAESFNIYIE